MQAIERTANAPNRPSVSNKPSVFRVAVVGCGPRGLFCLDRLAARLLTTGLRAHVEISVFELAPELGAGTIYDTSQPDYLRMNFSAKHIDAWTVAPQRPIEERSLVDYLGKNCLVSYGPESFVPRRLVGEYLKDCLAIVLQRLDPIADVNVFRERVCSIDASQNGWRVRTDKSARLFDEVLVTVGHESWRPPRNLAVPSDRVVPSVFPAAAQLCRKRIPSNTTVAIRGFGLTCIDAVLALTEGRGGRFISDSTGWKYVPSGKEPRCIFPFSRTGRPMLAKPIDSKLNLPAHLEATWEAGRADLRSIARPIHTSVFQNRLWPVFLQTALNALGQVRRHQGFEHGSRACKTDVQWFSQWIGSSPRGANTYRIMQHSADVAEGKVPPDFAWALGETWRRLYPVLVDRVSHGGLAPETWPYFERIAAEMERVAFGPPAENIRRMLAVADAGYLDFRLLTARLNITEPNSLRLNSGRLSIEPDVVINAVMPNPTDFDTNGPLTRLLDRGVIAQLHDTRGIEVDAAGTPLSPAGGGVVGLSILGRPTEGCILGNDTLSRVLHEQPSKWAEKVAARIATVAAQSE